MKVDRNLILTRRTIESRKGMYRLAQEAQTNGLVALLRKLVDKVTSHKCW